MSGAGQEEHGDRIHVYVRCRPLNAAEKQNKDPQVVDVFANQVTVRSKYEENCKTFTFDGAFGSNASQNDVYATVMESTVEEALKGFNCTVFAYGQTGTGKTFTMEGGLEGGAAWSADHQQSGMIPRAVNQIFRKLEHNIDIEYSVRVSHMELYNEELIDLLADSANNKPLKMLEHPTNGVAVHNLEEIPVTSADAIFKILRKSNKRRTTAATKMNAYSSRSHCIFTITVHTKETTLDGEEVIRVGKLNLVDLAGSENVGRSGAKQERGREAGLINQSLLTLGRVITSLVQGRPHIPYRESKLTRLLTESIGGRAKTSIIATIAPTSANVEETLSTLGYAHTAKNVTNKPQTNNTLTKKALIKDYTAEIERLKLRVLAAREKNGVFIPPEEHEKMEKEMTETREKLAEAEAMLQMKTSQLEELSTMFTSAKNELKQASGALKETAVELEDTKAKLVTAETCLDQTSKELDGVKAVAQARAITEETLFESANKVLQALEVREHDVEGLHSKLDRKRNVDGANEQITSDFRVYLSDRMDSLSGKVSDHTENHGEELTQLRGQVVEFMQQKTSDIDAMCERLDSLQSMILSQKEDLVALANSNLAESCNGVQQIEKIASTERGRVANAIEEYVQACRRGMDEWRAQLAAQTEQLNTWNTSTLGLIEAAKISSDSWTTQHKAELAEAKNRSIADQKKNEEWGQQHAQVLEGARESITVQMEDGKKNLLLQIGSIFNSFVTDINSSLAKSADGLVTSVDARKKEIQQQNNALAATLDDSLLPNVESRKAELLDNWGEVSESISGKVSGDVSRIQLDQERSVSWTDQVEKMEGEVKDLHGAVQDIIDTEAERTRTNVASFTKENGEEVDALVSRAGEWNEEAQGFVFFVGESVTTMDYNADQEVTEMKKSLEAWGARMDADVSGIGDRFDNYFYALKEDVATGETPLKRSLQYPRELPEAMPRDIVVAHYWENLAGGGSGTPPVLGEVPVNSNSPQEVSSPYQTPASSKTHSTSQVPIVRKSEEFSKSPNPLLDLSKAIESARLSLQACDVSRTQSEATPVKDQAPVEEQEEEMKVVLEVDSNDADAENAPPPQQQENQPDKQKQLPKLTKQPSKMTVKELKAFLKTEGLSDQGLKQALVDRVVNYLGISN